MSKARRYLITGPAWVGDMVMAQSLFMTIKQKYPDAVIDVLAPDWSLPLLERMPEIHRAISVPVGHGEFGLLARFKIGRSLRANNYTHAIVLPRSFKSALIPFFAGARTRIGYRGEMRFGLLNDIRKLDKSILKQTVQRYVALGLERDEALPPAIIPEPHLQVDNSNQERLVQEFGLTTDKPVVGMMPGAEYGPAKCWPIENFAKTAADLNAKGLQVWVFGSQKEFDLGAQIEGSSPDIKNLCGKTQLVDVVDLIGLTESVVSNDSGLMHVACATGRKVIAIYGSTDPAYTPPLSNKAKIVYLGLECSPCFERTCRFGHYDCLKKIDPERIEGLLLDGH
ncbi:MAG: lipopolysaccharide heptosyltransferase II [Gammaproteobacteria bacterium]|nr:lipopolysaccharide heptosyltransferase II [Gammaproteobacteria bacterium]